MSSEARSEGKCSRAVSWLALALSSPPKPGPLKPSQWDKEVRLPETEMCKELAVQIPAPSPSQPRLHVITAALCLRFNFPHFQLPEVSRVPNIRGEIPEISSSVCFKCHGVLPVMRSPALPPLARRVHLLYATCSTVIHELTQLLR